MVIVYYLNETSEFDLAMHVGEIDFHLLTGNEGLSYSNILSKVFCFESTKNLISF